MPHSISSVAATPFAGWFDETTTEPGRYATPASKSSSVMSGWNPHQLHPSILQREHWLANNLYRRQSFDVIHINPGMFAWTYFLGLPAIVHLGLLALPLGDGRNAPPSNEDVGRVAAGALADPATYIGRSLRPTGPEMITPSEAAEAMSRALGRTVRYKPVSEKDFIKASRAMGFPTFQIAQVRHYANEHRNGGFVGTTDHVETVTGAAPEGFDTIARRYLNDPSHIAVDMRPGSKLAALQLGFRIARTRTIDLDQWERTRDYPLIADGLLAHDNPDWRASAHQGQLALLADRRATTGPIR